MVDQNRAYLFKKRDIYYFSERIPSDLKHLYQVERLIQSFRTKCDKKAKSQALAMLLKLDDHWSKANLHYEGSYLYFSHTIIWTSFKLKL